MFQVSLDCPLVHVCNFVCVHQGEELRKIGHIGEADAGPAITSSRRWQKWGVVKVWSCIKLVISYSAK
jgi:hypothetical protein